MKQKSNEIIYPKNYDVKRTGATCYYKSHLWKCGGAHEIVYAKLVMHD